MTRSYDFVVATVVTLVAIVWHRIAVDAIAPDASLYETVSSLAVSGGPLNVGTRISFWFEIGVIWIPLIAIGAIWLYVFVREFRRQVATGAGEVRRAP